jgi:hypothetical protein
MTGNAAKYPLSPRAYRWLLKFNGVPDGWPVPRTWQYAANAYMQEYVERKAAEEFGPCLICRCEFNQSCECTCHTDGSPYTDEKGRQCNPEKGTVE